MTVDLLLGNVGIFVKLNDPEIVELHMLFVAAVLASKSGGV